MTTAAPSVSVYMPVYNGAGLLGQTLDSLRAQTHTDWELVAVDDGSSDDSWAVLQMYAERDDRIRPHRLEVNQGHHAASNIALERARGAYLARLDQDDLWCPRRLAAAVDLLDARPEIGYVHSGYARWLPDGALRYRCAPLTHTALRLSMMFGNRICHASVTLRRSAVEREPVHYRDLPGPQDYDLWLRLLAHTRSQGIPEPLVVYRQSEMAMTQLFADRIDAAVDELARQQVAPFTGDAAAEATLRVHRFGPAGPADRVGIAGVHRVYRDAPRRFGDLDIDEALAADARWTERALRSALSRAGGLPRDPRWIAELVRRDRRGTAAAIRRARR